MSVSKVEKQWSKSKIAMPTVYMLHFKYYNTYRIRYFPSMERVNKYIAYYKRPSNNPNMFLVMNIWEYKNGEDLK